MVWYNGQISSIMMRSGMRAVAPILESMRQWHRLNNSTVSQLPICNVTLITNKLMTFRLVRLPNEIVRQNYSNRLTFSSGYSSDRKLECKKPSRTLWNNKFTDCGPKSSQLNGKSFALFDGIRKRNEPHKISLRFSPWIYELFSFCAANHNAPIGFKYDSGV